MRNNKLKKFNNTIKTLLKIKIMILNNKNMMNIWKIQRNYLIKAKITFTINYKDQII